MAQPKKQSRAAAGEPVARRPRGARVSRAEKSEAIRRALLEAASAIVGEHGYAGASIARITMAAKVAQGTFYNYFESRDELFAHLLPEIGELMIAEIAEQVRPQKGFLAREEARMRGYLKFLGTHPGFYRLLREAETFAPEAHRQHMRNMVDGYIRAIEAERRRAGAPVLPPAELESAVYMILGARDYLAMRCFATGAQKPLIDDEIVRTYMRAVRGGLFSDIPDPAADR